MTKEVFPRWVKVNEQIQNVSASAHLSPASRPEAFCPLCMRPVILKLGNERVHHYAHQPEVVCAATQPETALHLNTKFHIYKQLLSGTKLYVQQQCSNSCGKSRNFSWAEDWERVEIESDIGSFRPDIVIVGSGGNDKAIEIKVTHPVEDDKAAFYWNQNIDWLEVEGSESIYDGENAWTIDQPLPSTCEPSLPEWTCKSCLEHLRREQEAEFREQRQAEYRKHNYSETIYSKMVDFYYRTGRKHRDAYFLHKIIRDDQPVGISVQTENFKVLFQQNGEDSQALIELAFIVIKHEVDGWRKFSLIVDDWEWLPWVYGKKYCAVNFHRYPFRYMWDQDISKWVLR